MSKAKANNHLGTVPTFSGILLSGKISSIDAILLPGHRAQFENLHLTNGNEA